MSDPASSPAKGAADETRQRLIEAATRGFAEHGVHAASLLEITRQAGQRNRGAVHYHFGSRTGMLVAVLDQHVDQLAARERELLTIARDEPQDLVAVVRALVLPAVELAELDGLGRCYLMILGELVEDDPASLDPEVVQALERLGGYEVYSLLEQRVPAMPDEVRSERLSLVTAFVLRAIADRSRAGDRPTPGRPQLETDPFARNLVAMVVGMLAAPLG